MTDFDVLKKEALKVRQGLYTFRFINKCLVGCSFNRAKKEFVFSVQDLNRFKGSRCYLTEKQAKKLTEKSEKNDVSIMEK